MDYWAGDVVWILHQQQNIVSSCKWSTPGDKREVCPTGELPSPAGPLRSCPVSHTRNA